MSQCSNTARVSIFCHRKNIHSQMHLYIQGPSSLYQEALNWPSNPRITAANGTNCAHTPCLHLHTRETTSLSSDEYVKQALPTMHRKIRGPNTSCPLLQEHIIGSPHSLPEPSLHIRNPKFHLHILLSLDRRIKLANHILHPGDSLLISVFTFLAYECHKRT